MRFLEYVSPADVQLHIAYHDKLNSRIWDGDQMKPEVLKRLLEISTLFESFLKTPNLKVVDRVVTGSIANYNWTTLSDIDLHLIIDTAELREACPDLFEEYLAAKKKIWNDLHDIKIHGFEVECYAQDSEEPHIASGVYSLVKRDWLIHPEHNVPDINDDDVRMKSADLMNRIDNVAAGDCSMLSEIEKIKEKIRKMRRAGLQRAGEFSTENLVFKTLRSDGYLDKLDDAKQKAVDQCLSL